MSMYYLMKEIQQTSLHRQHYSAFNFKNKYLFCMDILSYYMFSE